MRHVFLDHQSSTPVLPEVFDAMKPFFIEAFGNPSSLHQHGLRVRDALKTARQQIAALINADSEEEIFFTSDGTESANLDNYKMVLDADNYLFEPIVVFFPFHWPLRPA